MSEIPIPLFAGGRVRLPIGIHDSVVVGITPSVWAMMRGHQKWLLIANREMRCYKFDETIGRTIATPANAIAPRWHHAIEWWGRFLFWKSDKTVCRLWLRPFEPLTAPDILDVRLMEV